MLYGLVMIVKDGGDLLSACLESAKPYLSHYAIIDTGSSDDSPERITKGLDGIPGELVQMLWVNFGVCRSAAFRLARGTANWLLALDADMTVEIDPDFVPDPAVECYRIEMRDGGWAWRLPLLLRGDLPWVSRGAVHEYTALEDGRAAISADTDKVRVSFRPTPGGPAKLHWHAGLLEAELAVQPDNARDVFYLAQTYRELGDPRAIEMYRKRAGMVGYDQETWFAGYEAARLEPDWQVRMAALLRAWEDRPHRLEALGYALRDMNAQGLHQAVWLLTGVPIAPTSDTLFVEAAAWEWGIVFERSIAAWWVGEYEESHRLARALLDLELPDNIRQTVLTNQSLPPRNMP